MQYRSKPVEVEAVRYNRTTDTFDGETPWVDEALKKGDIHKYLSMSGGLQTRVRTQDGPKVIKDGYYLVKKEDGTLESWKPEKFEETFEPIGQEETE